MGNRIEKTLQAEYKGFQFLVLSENQKGGRKVPLFEIPNSNKRIIQDLGGLPQTFTITAIIAGDNYIQDSKKFISILLEDEPGTLILPVFGFNRVKAVEYAGNAENSAIGKIAFSIRFELLEMAGGVFVEPPTTQDIFDSYLEASNALADALLENWEPPKTNSNRLSAVNDSKSFLSTAKDAFKSVNQAVRQIEKVVGTIDTAINSAEMYAELYVKEGALAVVASVVGLGQAYQSASDMIDWGKELPDRLRNLGGDFGFNQMDASDAKDFSIKLWSQDETATWNERNNNRVLTVESSRFQALNLMLLQSVGLEFNSVNELDEVKLNLQSYFVALSSQQYSLLSNNSDFMNALMKLKELVFAFLDNRQKDLYQIREIEVENMSPIALAYLLYADESGSRDEIIKKADILVDLNDGLQIFDGKIKVLQR